MNREAFIKFLVENKGKILGVAIGLAFSILVLLIGFFKTVFIVFCVLLGYYIGNKIDNKENILETIEKIIPNEWK
ncbi:MULTISPECIES: DUF2273 domain-containing protein [Caloramator]|uniref:Uncharacterized membrane protein n=1 Tax=Caloramator proteoclasticus DSM 10124 TaxID=1121262 RepID=A0A1M4Y7H0_9CLOT|nr:MULTISPECIES: DUF2273 domain-containing protein [Caloramator]SHF01757.1 Uncharacterized membrane protein [Caloramator proteoclasticus DSM 10124]